MKKSAIAYTVIIALLSSILPMYVSASDGTPQTGKIYYVSPDGSDENDGSEEYPWKTMYHTANTLKPGDTAIFENGIYNETQITIFDTSGTADKPITVKARNKHKAVINYNVTAVSGKLVNNVSKLRITGTDYANCVGYINVMDFAITQASPAEPQEIDGEVLKPTGDILLCLTFAHNCLITGNKLYNAYEEGIKAYLSSYLTITDNEISDTEHEGIDCFAVAESKICGNKVHDFGRDGYMIKGNTCNTVVCHNTVSNVEGERIATGNGFDIGGMSDSTSPISIKENVAHENYNSVFYSNLIYSVKSEAEDGSIKNSIDTGIAFLGSKDCYCLNNTIIGTSKGVAFLVPSDKTNGWEWNPTVVNPVVKNNIFSDVTYAYVDNSGGELDKPKPYNVTRDYNLFHKCGNISAYLISSEENSKIIADDAELFKDYGTDWHITDGSQAVGAGDSVPETVPAFPGFSDEDIGNKDGTYKNHSNYEYKADRTITFDLTDFDGKARKVNPCDIGAYNRSFNCADILSLSIETKEGQETELPSDGATVKSITVRKLTTSDDVAVFIACYNEDDEFLICKNVALSAVTETPGAIPVNMTLPTGASGGYIRAYIWDFGKLKPIESSKRF